jgi:voltage-gated potassium channel
MRYFGAMGGRRVIRELLRDTASSAFALTIFLVLVVLELTGALIVAMEAGNPGANIQTAGDALWWGIVTITTVGYGDRYPVTGEGRLVGTFLLTAGIILFSVLTGFLTRQFFSPRDVSAAAATGRVDDAAPEGGDDARARIAALVALLDDQDQRQSVIRARLAELERMLEGAADRPPASA